MKKKNLEALNNEELLKKQQFFKVVNYIFTAAVLVMLVSNIITTITKGFQASSVIPIVFIPILMFNLNMLNQINKELKSRN